MNKSTITREESVQAVFDLKAGYTLELADIEILKRVARMALAELQAEPVMTANKLPETQFKQVADLYEMQFDDGRTCAFHTDAEKAVQWLNACDGNKVQEYVKLERLHDAVSGNSPVIPDGLIAAVNRLLDSDGSRGCYSAIQCGDAHDEIERLLAAAPQEVIDA